MNFVGGTLGLFVGMSVMSFIEIFMWIVNLLFKIIFRKKISSQKKKWMKKSEKIEKSNFIK